LVTEFDSSADQRRPVRRIETGRDSLGVDNFQLTPGA
jgi:hypothetical protein